MEWWWTKEFLVFYDARSVMKNKIMSEINQWIFYSFKHDFFLNDQITKCNTNGMKMVKV